MFKKIVFHAEKTYANEEGREILVLQKEVVKINGCTMFMGNNIF